MNIMRKDGERLKSEAKTDHIHKNYHKARKQKEKTAYYRERDVAVMTECEGELVAQRL